MTETDLPPAPLATFGFIAVGAVLLAAAGIFVATNRWSSGGAALSAPALKAVDAGEVGALRAIQDKVRRETEERARLDRTLSVTHADQLLHEVESTKAALEQARETLTEWESVVPTLLTSQEGMRIAADPAAVQTFDAIYRRAARPDDEDVANMQARINALEAELRRIKESQDALLSEEGASKLASEIEEQRRAAELTRESAANDLQAVQTLVAEVSSASPSTITLEAALRELELERTKRRAETIREAVEKVLVEAEKEDAAMEARKRREIADADRRQREADLETERMRKDAQAAITEQKAEQELLETLARAPEVQANYAPLLTKGKTEPDNNNPGGPGTMTWRDAGKLEAQYVSLSDIKRTNALNSFEDFVRLLTSTANDRGSWPVASSESVTTEYRRRFEEFQKLAPLWIEMEILRN